MSMTRKESDRIAYELSRVAYTSARPDAAQIARGIADMLTKQRPIFTRNGNRRFDVVRFYRLCGLNDDGE